MYSDSFQLTGALSIVVTGPNGEIKDSREVKNLVVSVGKTFIASRMTGAGAAVMSHMAIGSGTAAAVVGNTTLGTELARVALTSSSSSGAVATYEASFPAGTGTGAVTESGIFNAGTAGTLLCRTVFAVVNKGADDAMAIIWQVTAS
jgi:hypothetical protein